MSKQKQKGTAAETAVVNYLTERGINAVRNPPQGAKDKGDINLIGIPVIVEVKNHARMDLATWIREAAEEKMNDGAIAGIVWHKKRGQGSPGRWYVSMTGEDFLHLLDMIKS